ncbi:SAF domain-containing protein [Sulfurimonas sp. C5]|uniref:SAF domain-containing protein n=1 Tax=Sulfurimonas sp. C5 TaxID=3036947 RepID=UPI0024572FAA|nr:SAF domain-containing protein [Sulfurimonas sp. C5]MDH4944307.1 SAF domain-containing protein [Sulfurimonas sp. C5]
MKNKQMKTIILILIGLVLFMTSLALLMYSKQSMLEEQVKQVKLVEVFVTARDIRKGELLNADTIKKAALPKEYIVGTPLTASEIIGRYAVVDIYQNEPIREQKIALAKPEEKKSITLKADTKQEALELEETKGDTISLPLSVFKNIDSSLHKGDKIDIVSVENKKDGRQSEFKTKYIALNVTIESFVVNGRTIKSYISSDAKGNSVFAQNIVLSFSPKEIKNFLMLYYKTLELNGNRVYNTNNTGHLWIVKCSKIQDEDVQKKKEKMLADYVSQVKRTTKRILQADEARISYEQ